MLTNQNGMGTNQSEWSIGKVAGLRGPLLSRTNCPVQLLDFGEQGSPRERRQKAQTAALGLPAWKYLSILTAMGHPVSTDISAAPSSLQSLSPYLLLQPLLGSVAFPPPPPADGILSQL